MSNEHNDHNAKLLAQLKKPVNLPVVKWTSGGGFDVPHLYGGQGPITCQVQCDMVDGSIFFLHFTYESLKRFHDVNGTMLDLHRQRTDEAPPSGKPN